MPSPPPSPQKLHDGTSESQNRQNGTPVSETGNSSSSPEEDYFALNPPPSSLSHNTARARTFIARHAYTDRRIVLLTSGGTTVPLENQTVRFIDNFSAGTRGATSAEYFLDAGYAVIFLHRQHSLLPYSRHYSHSVDCFLDFMEEAGGAVAVSGKYQHKMLQVLRQYNDAKEAGSLLLLPFTTITEYLWLLRALAMLMRPVGARALFYLAAAVSDFFVPRHRMVEHKIQSGADFQAAMQRQVEDALEDFGESAPQHTGADWNPAPAARMEDHGKLVVDLDPVPKFLKTLVDGWAPGAMIVSFKLETDPELLTRKARSALKKYQHHLVIGNLLVTRKWEVVFVWNARETEGEISGGADKGKTTTTQSTDEENNVNAEIKEKWIRVGRKQRTKSAGGLEALVGRAELAGRREKEGQGTRDADGDNSIEDEERDDTQAASTDIITEPDPSVEIESLIVPEVKRLHEAFIARKISGMR